MKILALLLLAAQPATAALAQCVELPYPGMPPHIWEREAVWMKNIGVECLALPSAGALPTLLSIARKLDLHVLLLNGSGAQSSSSLDPQSEAHGGPVRWFSPDAAPQPVCRVSALSPKALLESRACFESSTGTLLWTGVETTIEPALEPGAISLDGSERHSLAALRRSLPLLALWAPFLARFSPGPPVRAVSGTTPGAVSNKLPDSFTARQFLTNDPVPVSAVSLTNRGSADFRGELRVFYPPLKQTLKLPEVTVPQGGALLLPVNLPLQKAARCAACNTFGNEESIVYATAELTLVEFENGILSLEFTTPVEAEAVLHLASEPSGPYVAAAKLRPFDWDPANNRARLKIPAGTGPQHHVRIGLVLSEPQVAAYFGDTKTLLIGESNKLMTSYSSPDTAKSTRLLAPAWLLPFLKPAPASTTPLQIPYTLDVPATALHGSHAEFALETAGARMSHIRLQLLRPVSLRVREALTRHYGAGGDPLIDPPLIPLEKAGANWTVVLRNNAPEIRTFTLEAIADALTFSQPKQEVVVAASSEREISLRVFAGGSPPGLHPVTLKVSGAARYELPVRALLLPRNEALTYTDGPLTVFETREARAVFSSGRWLEFVWKEFERNLLPDGGVALQTVRPLQLEGAQLTTTAGPLALRSSPPLSVATLPDGRVTYTLSRPQK